MVRSSYYLKIKGDPRRYKIYLEARRRYRENLKKDPIRYDHYKKIRRLERKRSYQKHKEQISLRTKKKYATLPKEEKLRLVEKAKFNRIKRRKIIVEKWGGKCQRCGYSEHPEILQFDHKKALYRVTNGIKKEVSDHMLKEIVAFPERFEMLCCNCHMIKTREDVAKLWQMKKSGLIVCNN